MFVSLGHDDSAARRRPWVTWSVLAICTGAVLLTDLEATRDSPTRNVYLEQAADYFREHAYLDGHSEILDHVRNEVPPSQRSQYLPTLRDLTKQQAPEQPAGIAAEQTELDRLTDLALGPGGAGEPVRANPFRRWGLVPGSMTATASVTHLFLHAGWLHLLGNMALLCLIGPAVEDRWRRPIYASFYLAVGILAGVSFAMLSRDPSVPLVGASGAIAGVVGAFLIRHGSAEMRFAFPGFIGRHLRRRIFRAPAWSMLPLWLCVELLNAQYAEAAGIDSGVVWWTHVGGFAFGGAAALAIRLAKIERPLAEHVAEPGPTALEDTEALDTTPAEREPGNRDAAFLELRQQVAAGPAGQADTDTVLAFWRVASSVQQPEAAAPALAGAIKQLVGRGDLELARDHWLELVNLVPTQRVEPRTLLRLLPLLRERDSEAGDGRADGDAELVRLALRHAIDPGNRGLSAGMAMRIVDEAVESDPDTAIRAARIALGNPDLHETKREKLEALVRELGQRSGDEAIAALVASPRFADLKLVEGTPTRVDTDALYLATPGTRRAKIEYSKVDAIAVALVEGIADKSVLLIDLLLNWNDCGEGPLRAVRLRSDRFDARALSPGFDRSSDALRDFALRLLERCDAVPLPDPEAISGRPFAVYESLASYEREVLQVAR